MTRNICKVFKCDKPTESTFRNATFCVKHNRLRNERTLDRIVDKIHAREAQRVEGFNFFQPLEKDELQWEKAKSKKVKEMKSDPNLIKEVFSNKLGVVPKLMKGTREALETLDQEKYLKACELSNARRNLKNPHTGKEA